MTKNISKVLLLIGVLFFTTGCSAKVYRDFKEKAVINSVMTYAETARITTVTEKEDKRLTLVILSDGTKFEVPLVRVMVIAVLRTPAGAPYLLLSAATCRECDMNQSIYIVPQKISVSRDYLPRNSYPGVFETYDTGELAREIRMFYGRCLPEAIDVVVWYGKYLDENNRWNAVKYVIRLTDDGPIEFNLADSKRMLKNVLARVDSEVCYELAGVHGTTEP